MDTFRLPSRPWTTHFNHRVAEDGNLVSLEHGVWQLLEVFFIDATYSGGFIAEVQRVMGALI